MNGDKASTSLFSFHNKILPNHHFEKWTLQFKFSSFFKGSERPLMSTITKTGPEGFTLHLGCLVSHAVRRRGFSWAHVNFSCYYKMIRESMCKRGNRILHALHIKPPMSMPSTNVPKAHLSKS